MTYRKINILRKWVIRSGLQQSKLSVVRIVVLGSLMRDPSCPLRTSVILSTLILRGGWVGAANTKKNITSAGTATPTTGCGFQFRAAAFFYSFYHLQK